MSGDKKPRIELSAVQVVGGAMAAASAAVAASLLGVAGTVIGAAVASILTTVGGAMYTHSMRRGKDALERARTTRLTHLGRLPAGKEPAEEARSEGKEGAAARSGWRDRFRGLNPRTVAITSACALVLALGVITGVEALIGKPISSALGGGKDHKGTSIGALARGGNNPAPKKTPGGSSTPTPTVTTTVTRTPTTTPTKAPLRRSTAPSTSKPAPTRSTSHAPSPAPSTSSSSSTHTVPGGVQP